MSLRLPLIFLSLLGCGLVKITVTTTVPPSTQTSPTEVTTTIPVTASTPVVPVDPKLYWVILHAENPSGQAGGQPCSIFDFAGVQCSLSFDYTLTSEAHGNISNTAVFSPGNSADSTNMSSLSTPLNGSFQGFTISGTLKAGDQTVATFDTYTVSTPTKGVMTLTDPVSGASVRFAWKSDLNPATTVVPTTTPQSTTPPDSTTTTTPYTGPSTVPTTTPVQTYPRDCEEVTDRTDGVKSIFINKDKDKGVDVYCQFGSSGALTTIQSRGDGDFTEFGDNFTAYESQFGVAGNNTNFWFGLENMHLLTAGNVSYNLLIEVCCNGNSTKQIYESFTIGDSSTTYTLNAMADSVGFGLDLTAVGVTNKKDIGQKFSTKNTINATGLNLDDCEILYRWDGSATGSGGWWFGSCANNLNGKYHASTATCLMNLNTTMPAYDTGIELRTTTGIIDEENGFFADLVSYTRVRMAVYRRTTPLQGISGFCST